MGMDVVYAKGSFFIGTRRIDGGTVWPADDPVVKGHPGGFTADPSESPGYCRSTAPQPVEQATAAPGEKRATRRAR